MSNLMSNIRKASLPLQESSAQLGRLLLQLGQAADSQLDAETLAELDKQASFAACQELEKAAAAAAAAAPEGGEAEESTEEEDSTAVEEAGADERKKDECVANEESSTATTVELSADSSHHEDACSSSSSSGHVPQQQAGGSDSSATPGGADASSSSSLMRASSVHSTNSSSHAVASSSSSSSRHGGAPSPLPRSARSSREASLVFPGGILSAPVRKEEQPPPPPAGGGGEEEEEEEEEEAPAAKPAAADGPVKVMLQGFALQADDDKLVVCESKALAHLFTRIRNRDTPPPVFRFYATRMMRILAEEGIACLESSRQFITTPTAATFSSPFVNESNVCIVSILRAGDALAETAQACIPTAPVGKILIQRDEESSDKHPVLFYKKLPSKIATMQVLLCDPMLATGGSALMAIRCLVEAGVKEAAIVFITVVVCPEGIGALRAEFPEVTIVTGAMDDCLDEKRYILPGLGDFGDRFFGTVS
ncbi:unnamed protein product [Ectocarpus sp. 4 AP-2014]